MYCNLTKDPIDLNNEPEKPIKHGRPQLTLGWHNVGKKNLKKDVPNWGTCQNKEDKGEDIGMQPEPLQIEITTNTHITNGHGQDKIITLEELLASSIQAHKSIANVGIVGSYTTLLGFQILAEYLKNTL